MFTAVTTLPSCLSCLILLILLFGNQNDLNSLVKDQSLLIFNDKRFIFAQMFLTWGITVNGLEAYNSTIFWKPPAPPNSPMPNDLLDNLFDDACTLNLPSPTSPQDQECSTETSHFDDILTSIRLKMSERFEQLFTILNPDLRSSAYSHPVFQFINPTCGPNKSVYGKHYALTLPELAISFGTSAMALRVLNSWPRTCARTIVSRNKHDQSLLDLAAERGDPVIFHMVLDTCHPDNRNGFYTENLIRAARTKASPILQIIVERCPEPLKHIFFPSVMTLFLEAQERSDLELKEALEKRFFSYFWDNIVPTIFKGFNPRAFFVRFSETVYFDHFMISLTNEQRTAIYQHLFSSNGESEISLSSILSLRQSAKAYQNCFHYCPHELVHHFFQADELKKTILHYALDPILTPKFEYVARVIDTCSHIDPWLADKEKMTPFHLAAQHADPNLLKLVYTKTPIPMRRGCFEPNARKETALHLSLIHNPSPEKIDMLLRLCPNKQSKIKLLQDDGLDGPMHIIAKKALNPLLPKALLTACPETQRKNLFAANKDGKTPLILSRYNTLEMSEAIFDITPRNLRTIVYGITLNSQFTIHHTALPVCSRHKDQLLDYLKGAGLTKLIILEEAQEEDGDLCEAEGFTIYRLPLLVEDADEVQLEIYLSKICEIMAHDTKVVLLSEDGRQKINFFCAYIAFRLKGDIDLAIEWTETLGFQSLSELERLTLVEVANIELDQQKTTKRRKLDHQR